LGLEEFLLDYRKPVLDGSLCCGDEFEVSEKGVQIPHLFHVVVDVCVMVILMMRFGSGRGTLSSLKQLSDGTEFS
jgi:hypothetical protein